MWKMDGTIFEEDSSLTDYSTWSRLLTLQTESFAGLNRETKRSGGPTKLLLDHRILFLEFKIERKFNERAHDRELG